jgi:hypothetical protein
VKEPCIKSRHSREACPILDTVTGIQKDIARHNFWIPTYVGMTKRLKNNTYDTKPGEGERATDYEVSASGLVGWDRESRREGRLGESSHMI